MNYSAVVDYFALGYISAPKSILRKVSKLEPGHHIIIKDGNLKKTQYWDVSFIENREISIEDHQENIRHYLDEAVKRRLVSDVPLGVFLSGGIDSSSIVAMASKARSEPVKTFALGFGEPTDELDDARLVAARFAT